MKDASFGGSLSQGWKKIVNFPGGTKMSSRKTCCANSAETEEKTLMIQTIKTFWLGIYHRVKAIVIDSAPVFRGRKEEISWGGSSRI